MEKIYTIEEETYYTFVVQNPSEIVFKLIEEFSAFLSGHVVQENAVRISFYNYSENDEEIILTFHDELMAQEYKPIL